MKTAEEFLKERGYNYRVGKKELQFSDVTKDDLIEFTKMHVENAKKEYERIILQEGLVTEAGVAYLQNAYPLTLIK